MLGTRDEHMPVHAETVCGTQVRGRMYRRIDWGVDQLPVRGEWW